MTENEARQVIECIGEKLTDNSLVFYTKVEQKAIDMAIQALEKQIPKKPILCMNETSGMFVDYADGQGEFKTQMNNWWKCPCCNSVVGQRVVLQDLIHDQKKKKFCENCGQKIEW